MGVISKSGCINIDLLSRFFLLYDCWDVYWKIYSSSADDDNDDDDDSVDSSHDHSSKKRSLTSIVPDPKKKKNKKKKIDNDVSEDEDDDSEDEESDDSEEDDPSFDGGRPHKRTTVSPVTTKRKSPTTPAKTASALMVGNTSHTTTKTNKTTTKISTTAVTKKQRTSRPITPQPKPMAHSKHHHHSVHTSLAVVVQKVVLPHIPNDNHPTLWTSVLRAVVPSFSSNTTKNPKKKPPRRPSPTTTTTDRHAEMIQSVVTTFFQQVQTEMATNVYPTMDDTNVILMHLYNWIFASVGGTTPLLEDPNHATAASSLEEMTDEDWTNHMDLIVEEMSQNTTSSQFTISTKSAASLSTSQQEFYTIYNEFWYHLTTMLLTSYNNTSSGNDNEDDDDDDNGRFRVELVRQIVSRLIELVNVGVPDIRYAMTMALYQMGSALLQHTTTLQQKVGPVQRQYQVAQQNHQKKKASAMQNQIQLWKRTMTDCEEIVKELIVTTVFTIRYKDHDPMIRRVSLQSLHQYCMIRSDLFLSSFYLKYFGWMMSDKHPMVRMAAIQGLMKPLAHNILATSNTTGSNHRRRNALSQNDDDDDGKDVDITSHMTSVVTKFLPRIVDCVIDVDVAVQESAMEFVLLLLRHYDYFNDIDNERMWNQINIRALDPHTSQNVRTNALYFVLEQLDVSSSSTNTNSNAAGSTNSSEREVVTQLYAIGKWYVVLGIMAN